MNNKFIPKTIRGRIMAVTAAITFIITIITITVCFLVFQSFLKKNQIQSTEYSLQITANNIAADVDDITYLANWCCANAEIRDYLKAFDSQDRLPMAAKQDSNLRPMALTTYNRLKSEFNGTRARQHINRVIVSTVNQNNYLQMVPNSGYTASNASEIIRDSQFFDELCQGGDFLWLGLVDNPFYHTKPEQVLPIVRPIYNEYNSEQIGWVYVEICSSLFTSYLDSFPLAKDSPIFLVIGEKTYEFSKGGWGEAPLPFTIVGDGDNASTLAPETQVKLAAMADGSRRTLIARPIEGMKGCYISQLLSAQQKNQQTTVYSLLIVGICAAIISLGILLSLILNRIINQPIAMLRSKLAAIAKGDFTKDPDIEWEHELGQIGRGINNMSENIVSLMDKRVADEKQKKDLEYQILQSQINPHFLYNTLNSIKWMATIQNATGIADMTTALARLLKSVSKGSSSMVTLKEELDLIKDYFLIQQYRYGGSITIEYQIGAPDLYDCEIHRFTLQPIIENALFHGIEPKGTAGRITVAARAEEHPQRAENANGTGKDGTTAADAEDAASENRDLVITITDNGVGMTQETIQKVLSEDAASNNKTDFFKQVGISNVNQRIKYDFGPEYGITIQSQVGQYTAAIIRRPYVNRKIPEKFPDANPKNGGQ